jgi:SGT1 protein
VQKLQGTAAQVNDKQGTSVLTVEASDFMPEWLDDERHGRLDTIARHRVWIYDGHLHIVPRKHPTMRGLEPGKLTFDAAWRAVWSDNVPTHALCRAQEHLKRSLFSLGAAARARESAQRMRACLPLWAASVLVHRTDIATAAAKAIVGRAGAQWTAALSDTAVWPRIASRPTSANGDRAAMTAQDGQGRSTVSADTAASGDELVMCTLRLRKRHFYALTDQPMTVPKAWQVPRVATGHVGRAVEHGMSLALGLRLHAAALGVDLSAARRGEASCIEFTSEGVREWEEHLSNLKGVGYFLGNVEGSKEYNWRLEAARAEFKPRGRHAECARELVQLLLQAPVGCAAVAASAKLPADEIKCVRVATAQKCHALRHPCTNFLQ